MVSRVGNVSCELFELGPKRCHFDEFPLTDENYLYTSITSSVDLFKKAPTLRPSLLNYLVVAVPLRAVRQLDLRDKLLLGEVG